MPRISKIIFLPLAILLLGAGCLGTGSKTLQDGGVYKSADGGATWQSASAVPSVSGTVSMSEINVLSVDGDPHHAQTLYVATAGSGLYASYDMAGQWRKLGNIGDTVVRAFAVDPVEPCTLYASIGARVMKSRDCGRVWNPVYEVSKEAQEVRAIAIAPDNRMRIYAGLDDGVFLISQNGGSSWAVVNRFGSFIRDIVVDPKKPSRMFIVTEKKGLWRSNDAGATWEDLSEQLKAFTGYKRGWSLERDQSRDNNFVYSSTYGLLRTADGGDTWNSIVLITAPGEAKIYAAAANPLNSQEIYYSAVVGGKPLLYKTVDGGVNWKTIKLPTTRIPVSIYIRPDAPNQVFLGMYQAAN